jgi:hypothetical protein
MNYTLSGLLKTTGCGYSLGASFLALMASMALVNPEANFYVLLRF